mmetsp:Transcript_4098/g.6111  ORF Transcript_4098/g.6111 Transcript_4098/m.6111 type:complete len:155 (+) Transcript_4098:282-746(+)
MNSYGLKKECPIKISTNAHLPTQPSKNESLLAGNHPSPQQAAEDKEEEKTPSTWSEPSTMDSIQPQDTQQKEILLIPTSDFLKRSLNHKYYFKEGKAALEKMEKNGLVLLSPDLDSLIESSSLVKIKQIRRSSKMLPEGVHVAYYEKKTRLKRS